MSDPGFLRKLARTARAVAPKAAPKVEDIYHPPGSPEREENFARFLSGSKIRNDEGDPLRLYHITKGDFNEFVPGGSVDPKAWESGPATWLSPYPDKQPAAHQVGGYRGDDGERVFRSGTNVMPVHAAIKNPLIIDDATSYDWARKVFADDSAEFPQLLSPQTRARMLEDGYDGIVYAGPSSTRATEAFYGSNAIGTHPDREEEIISLLPNSLKSAIGNRGTYDPMLPDINKAQGGPVEMDTGGGVLRKLIHAYHGSPYAFDKFDPTKIGSGEGAQAYGYGHYFTDKEDIARGYRDKLTEDRYRLPTGEFFSPDNLQHLNVRARSRRLGTDLQGMLDEALKLRSDQSGLSNMVPLLDRDIEMLKGAIGAGGITKAPGHMYDVSLGVNPQDLLNWDAPLSTQTRMWDKIDPSVRRYIDESMEDRGNNSFSDALDGYTGRHLYGALKHPDVHDALPDELPRSSWLTGETTPKRHTADYLKSLDIPGIKYLDGFSRGAGEGTSNYVMFPGTEDLININRRYADGGPVDTPTEGEGGMYGAPDSMFNTPESLAAALYPQHDTAYNGGGKVRSVLQKAGQLARDALLGDLPEYRPGEETYLRFGKWPENERSQNFITGDRERGVSVFGMEPSGLPESPNLIDTFPYRMSDHLSSTHADDPLYLVQGRPVGEGYDGEPLIQDITRLPTTWHRPQRWTLPAQKSVGPPSTDWSQFESFVKPYAGDYADGGPVHMALGGTPPNTAPAVPDMPQLSESEGAGFFRNNDNENYAGQLDWLKKLGAPTIQRPGKVQDVHNWASKVGGAEQGRRVEQAADLTNLGHFSSNALHETFAPGNSSLLMALPPSVFEHFSARLPDEYMARTPYGRWKNNVPGQERIPDSQKTMDAYLAQLRDHMDRGGANEVPAMWLAPPRPLYGEVAQHQGRHRARAMAQAGEENMLLHIKPANDGDMRGSLAERLERLTDKYFPSGAATRFEPEMDWKRRIPLSFPLAPFAEGGEVHMSTGGQYDAPEPEGAGYLRNNVGDMYAGVDDLIKGGWRTALARQHKQDTPKGKAAPPDRRLQTVTDPERMVYPGIYKDPDVIAEEASRRLMRDQGKDGPMSLLFGHTRASLDELSQGRDLEGMRPWPLRQAYTPPGGSTGSAVSEQVLTRRNANRLLDIHGEAMKYPGLRETRSWYEMSPMYQRMDELGVPIDEQRLFNQRTGIFSAAASPVSEINRGTLAHYLAQQGRIEDFVKYGGVAAKNRPSLLGFPDDLLDMKSHSYHRTAQAPTLAEIEMSGGYYPKEHKVGTYVAATDPVFPNYTRPVADSHIARGVGYSDVRPGKLANVKANLSNPEYTDFAPWWENSIAGNTGLRSRDQQALLWNVLGPQTGVRYIGPSKLELMSNQMMQASKRLGVSPEQARDMVLRGEAGAYKEGGTVEDQYHPIWQQSFSDGGQPESESRGYYTKKEQAAIARQRNAERIGEITAESNANPGAYWRDLLTQIPRGAASIAELPGLAGDLLNYRADYLDSVAPGSGSMRVPHWGTSEGISQGLDSVFPETTTKHGAAAGRELGEMGLNMFGLGMAQKMNRFAHMGNAANLGFILGGGSGNDTEPAEWQAPPEPSYAYERFMRDHAPKHQAYNPSFHGYDHGGSVEDQYHPIWSQNFKDGGGVHDILGMLGGLAGNLIPIPVLGPMLGKFAGHALGDLIEGGSGEIGDDAARDFTFGMADPDKQGWAGGGPVDDFTEPGMPSFGPGIPGFDVDMLPTNPQVARDRADRQRLMQMTEQASQRGLAQQMKPKDSGGGGGGGMGDIMGMAMKMAPQIMSMMASHGGPVGHYADGGRIPAPNGEQPWMYGGGALMARGGYLRSHGGMNG